MILKQKKGIQLSEAFMAVLIVVLVGVLLVIAIVLFVAVGDTFVNLETATFENTGAYVVNNSTAATMSNVTACNSGIVSITNATRANLSSEVITSDNYTFTTSGTIIKVGAGNGLGSSWNVSYSYPWGGASCNAANNMVTQFATYPALLGLVGTIVFLGLVIGVLVASFVMGRKEEL